MATELHANIEGDAISNPCWQRNEFFKQNSNLQASIDSGIDPLASTQIAFPGIASTEINSAETPEPAPDNPFLANAALNQPIPLADLTFPGSSSSLGPEYVDGFNVKRSRKQRRDINSTINQDPHRPKTKKMA